MSSHFHKKAAQCLILSEYTKPQKNTVEALILYFASETIRHPGLPFSLHIVFGIIVRIAMRMGYHRDGSLYPSISVFQAEMRRRVWTWIRMADILMSSQLGMPRLIAEGVDDTAIPLNLLDDDFDEDIVKLPSPRSDLESTAISYLVQKSKLIEVLGRIITTVNHRTPITNSKMMELDEHLGEVHRSLPPWLLVKARTSFITDAPHVLLRRIAIDMAYRRAQCILHRRSFYLHSQDTYCQYSRNVCVKAAMQILDHQSSLYKNAQPGGCFHQERWKMTWHYTNDFLLGAVILYLELRSMVQGRQDEQNVPYPRRDLMKAIHGSFEIWAQASATSNEAANASHILSLMLENLGVTSNATIGTISHPPGNPGPSNHNFMREFGAGWSPPPPPPAERILCTKHHVQN
ncbi:uncharacterized protein A1O9_12841 [Exophiala aquamarina CBS 119918]|uniref:Xylanolytic transcriptional activator regulatory domain-containing protein n=1 Tax=Exophiala aquamarina CBS 119918 TaxID=1182545 RepID=A0A072NVQ7_9EURO|nr:uncharacterized protein A1O9_12841 [Exophiala aquamarina CBS 119918]KEF51118.1 hypothetical protein A1O9_12841 [Exophiala aquamarina CBS 119918]